MKLSIITINYNNFVGLKNTMDSVFEQDYEGIEFIVIDGGSDDGSLEQIMNHKEKLRYWVSEKDEGIYHAQNKGLLKATAEYCLFLNSGDTLANKEIISNVVPDLISSDIVYGDLITIDNKGKENLLKSPDHLDAQHFMISTLWHPTAFIKRELFHKYGLYNQSFKVAADYEFFIRVILKYNVSTKHIKKAICVFDLKGISNSTSMSELQTQERKWSWELNFSPKIIESLEQLTRVHRSKEYKLAQLFRSLVKPFKLNK